jgi:FkbM family methyltransferase
MQAALDYRIPKGHSASTTIRIKQMRFPSKTNALNFIKEAGIPINTVIDVGAHEETPELRTGFPNLRHILFEPATNFHEALRRNYSGMNFEVVSSALSSHNGTGHLRKHAIDGGEVTHSTLVDPADGKHVELVETIRLDTFLKARAEAKPYLLKIDVDGYEIPIMQGAEGIWDDVSCVIVEATTDTLHDRLSYVLSKGFRLFDIIDQCYYYGVMSQVDLVFIRADLYSNENLRPWETRPFGWDKWVPVASFEGAVRASASSGG